MRKTVYSAIGLFFLSLLFVGSSFSGDMEMSKEFTESTPMAVNWNTWKASDLLGTTLKGPTGSVVDIGSINDVAVNPSTGEIDSLLVKDIRGLGAKEIAIPFHDVSMLGEATFVYNPPGDMYRFDGEDPFQAYDLLSLPPMREGDYRFTTLLGASVESKEGDHIAHIDDFIINTDGHVVYVVFADVGGMESKMVAVPLGTLSRKSEHLFALHTTKEQLFAAPAFDWSDVNSMRYAGDIYRYYGLVPYWEMQ